MSVQIDAKLLILAALVVLCAIVCKARPTPPNREIAKVGPGRPIRRKAELAADEDEPNISRAA